MSSYSVVLFVIAVIIGHNIVLTDALCQQEGPCRCTLDNGTEFDLTQLGLQNGSALIHDLASEPYSYSFNPCYPFTEGDCQAVAGCQYDIGNQAYYIIGDANNPQLIHDGEKLIGKYSHTGSVGNRETTVDYICDPDADTPVVSTDGEVSIRSYKFTIKSKHACVTAIPTPSPIPTSTPKPWCTTDYQDFIKRCYYGYDGHAEPVKLLIIHEWNGVCHFPTSLDVAMHLYSNKATCHGVSTRCHPDQPFAVNDEVCKEP